MRWGRGELPIMFEHGKGLESKEEIILYDVASDVFSFVAGAAFFYPGRAIDRTKRTIRMAKNYAKRSIDSLNLYVGRTTDSLKRKSSKDISQE